MEKKKKEKKKKKCKRNLYQPIKQSVCIRFVFFIHFFFLFFATFIYLFKTRTTYSLRRSFLQSFLRARSYYMTASVRTAYISVSGYLFILSRTVCAWKISAKKKKKSNVESINFVCRPKRIKNVAQKVKPKKNANIVKFISLCKSLAS